VIALDWKLSGSSRAPSSTSCHQSTFVGVAIVVHHNRLNLGIRQLTLPNLAKASFRSLRWHNRIEHAARASPQSVEAARIPHREDRADGRTIYRWEVLMPQIVCFGAQTMPRTPRMCLRWAHSGLVCQFSLGIGRNKRMLTHAISPE